MASSLYFVQVPIFSVLYQMFNMYSVLPTSKPSGGSEPVDATHSETCENGILASQVDFGSFHLRHRLEYGTISNRFKILTLYTSLPSSD